MFLYSITNLLTGKQYIGITIMPVVRFSDHTRAKTLIGNAIRKYGKKNFEMKLLVEGPDQYIADLEAPLILSFNTLHPNGYNLSLETHKTFRHHDESKAKMRKPKSDEAKKNMSIAKKGKPNGRKGIFKHTDETKSKLSDKFKGIPKTQEFKDKLAGRKMSEETKLKMSQARKRYLEQKEK